MSGEIDACPVEEALRRGRRRIPHMSASEFRRSQRTRSRRLAGADSPGCDAGSVFVFVMCQNSSKRIVSATASRLVVGDVLSSGVVVRLLVGDADPERAAGIGISDQTRPNESPLIGFRERLLVVIKDVTRVFVRLYRLDSASLWRSAARSPPRAWTVSGASSGSSRASTVREKGSMK